VIIFTSKSVEKAKYQKYRYYARMYMPKPVILYCLFKTVEIFSKIFLRINLNISVNVRSFIKELKLEKLEHAGSCQSCMIIRK
jgi:hypothetical protein